MNESLSPTELREELIARLDEENRPDLASRLSKCGKPLVLRCASCTSPRHCFTRCDLKWCPSCQRAIAARTAQRYATIAESCTWPLFVTFTCEHDTNDDVGLLRSVRRAHTKLRRLRWWKRAVIGGVISFEVTNRGENGWHPHGHALIDCRWLSVSETTPARNASKAQWRTKARRAVEEVAQQWSLCLGRKGSVKVRRVWQGDDGSIGAAVHEVLKYSVKGTELIEVAEPIAGLIDVLDRTRLVCSWGSFYRHAAVKRQRAAPAMCACGCSEWCPEDLFVRKCAVNSHGL
jgi:hypothetical protein